jgi:hypothetical protein
MSTSEDNLESIGSERLNTLMPERDLGTVQMVASRRASLARRRAGLDWSGKNSRGDG